MSETAIVLAAGKGTRMKSDRPKVLHEVGGRPMLSYVLDACRDAGCERLIVVIGHQADRVRSVYAGRDADITWVRQSPQLGTGHAVMVCRDELERLSGPVLVLAGDGPLIRGRTLRRVFDTHAEAQAGCTLATSILDEPGHYGRIVRDADGELAGIVEWPEADQAQRQIREVNVSVYCFDVEALRGVLDRLDKDNAKGEYYLTDALSLLRQDGWKLAAVAAVPPEEVLGINSIAELEEVHRILAARDGAAATREAGRCDSENEPHAEP